MRVTICNECRWREGLGPDALCRHMLDFTHAGPPPPPERAWREAAGVIAVLICAGGGTLALLGAVWPW